MKISVKRLMMAGVVALIAAVGVQTIDAQPNIPRRYGNSRPARVTRNPGMVWGTQYDWLSERYATRADIQGLAPGQIRVLKNSLYARKGYIFRDSHLANYFGRQWWYTPRYRSVSGFTRVEQANIQFLGRYDH